MFQITNLISKYLLLSEEVKILNKIKLNNTHNEDMISEMIAVSINTLIFLLLKYYNYICMFYSKITCKNDNLRNIKIMRYLFKIILFQISIEKESLKREVAEMNERIQLMQKSSRELELDNEKLAFKVSNFFFFY